MASINQQLAHPGPAQPHPGRGGEGSNAGAPSVSSPTPTPPYPQDLVIQPFPLLSKAAVEGLRYRAEDCAAKVTRLAVKEARAKELRMELLTSEV